MSIMYQGYYSNGVVIPEPRRIPYLEENQMVYIFPIRKKKELYGLKSRNIKEKRFMSKKKELLAHKIVIASNNRVSLDKARKRVSNYYTMKRKHLFRLFGEYWNQDNLAKIMAEGMLSQDFTTGKGKDPQAVSEALSRLKGFMRTNSTESTVSNTKFETEVDKLLTDYDDAFTKLAK